MQEQQIKAIPTRYKGYHFRSRLEARWAVFFDAIGRDWEYEPEGYYLGRNFECGGLRQYGYIPDFYLVDEEIFVEVKPSFDLILKDLWKYKKVVNETQYGFLFACGQPSPKILNGYRYSYKERTAVEIHYLMEYVEEITEASGECIDTYDTWYKLGDPIHQFYDDDGITPWVPDTDLYEIGCEAASSARFEHGECGAT